MCYKSAIIVPLYIYPFRGAWDPLYEAITGNPNLSFVIILNPNSGPGIIDPFDFRYAREIPRLNAYANVCTVGYIRTNYCQRPMAEVGRDIETYASWAQNFTRQGLAVHGIFVDETPNLYEPNKADYLRRLDQIVKTIPGIQGQRLVIHNPGTVPDSGFKSPGPDVAAVFEGSFNDYRSTAVQERMSALLSYKRDQCAYFVHSVPIQEMKQLVLELRQSGSYIFATGLCGDFYERFGPSWKEFVEAMQMETSS